MEVLIGIVIAGFGILQIILFFKLWGMTDDIRDIKEKYLHGEKASSIVDDLAERDFTEDQLVIHLKTEKQMRAGEYSDGKYDCYVGGAFVGEFSKDEIMPFDEWVKNKK